MNKKSTDLRLRTMAEDIKIMMDIDKDQTIRKTWTLRIPSQMILLLHTIRGVRISSCPMIGMPNLLEWLLKKRTGFRWECRLHRSRISKSIRKTLWAQLITMTTRCLLIFIFRKAPDRIRIQVHLPLDSQNWCPDKDPDQNQVPYLKDAK